MTPGCPPGTAPARAATGTGTEGTRTGTEGTGTGAVPRILVVGLGSPDRGDDGVGPAVASAVAAALDPGQPGPVRHADQRGAVHVVAGTDPSHLLDLLVSGRWDAVVVIDAVGGPAPPSDVVGRVHPAGRGHPASGGDAGACDVEHPPEDVAGIIVMQTGQGLPGIPAIVDPGRGGTHSMGLAATIELARALGMLPERVVVVGVTGHRFELGASMGADVRAAVPKACGEVLGHLAELA